MTPLCATQVRLRSGPYCLVAVVDLFEFAERLAALAALSGGGEPANPHTTHSVPSRRFRAAGLRVNGPFTDDGAASSPDTHLPVCRCWRYRGRASTVSGRCGRAEGLGGLGVGGLDAVASGGFRAV